MIFDKMGFDSDVIFKRCKTIKVLLISNISIL